MTFPAYDKAVEFLSRQTCGYEAEISDCKQYRYALRDFWPPTHGGGVGLFLGINPSTADGLDHDHTTMKLQGFATRWGWRGHWLMNPFALRSTDQRGLLESGDPVGPDNGLWLLAAFERADIIVCAWGSGKTSAVRKLLAGRLWGMRTLLIEHRRKFRCLGRSKDGSPRHPLMLSYNVPLEPYDLEAP